MGTDDLSVKSVTIKISALDLHSKTPLTHFKMKKYNFLYVTGRFYVHYFYCGHHFDPLNIFTRIIQIV